MIKLQTPVTDDKCKVGISFSDRIMMLGSCFSDNIGRQLHDFGFNVCVNPFGTLYNPLSILDSIEKLVGEDLFTEEDCTDMGAGSGLICSFHHHTSFARSDNKGFLENANERLCRARELFKDSNRIIITLGTSWYFRHKMQDIIVSNCLKRPAAEFERKRMSASQTSDALKQILSICNDEKAGKEKKVIFTVSPIRHFKDGAHGNQLSKATLLLGIDDVISSCPEGSADYFPAYEIMMDELRDYRFYSEDMCHPSSQAVDYIRERFLDWGLPADERPQLDENIRNYRRSCHIPVNKQ